MKFKRFVAAVSAAMMGVCLAGNVSATNDLNSEEGNVEDLLATSDEEFDEYFGEPVTIIQPRTALPSSVVDVSDVVAINMSLLSTASLSELIKINAVNARVQEYCISNDLGVDIYEN